MSQRNLTFSLSMDTEGLRAGLASATKGAEKFKDSVREIGEDVRAGMAKAAASAESAAKAVAGIGNDSALKALSRQFSELGDNVPKTSRQFQELRQTYKSLLDAMAEGGMSKTEQYAAVRDALRELDAEFAKFRKTASTPVDSKIADISADAADAAKELKKAEGLLRRLASGSAEASGEGLEELKDKIAALRDRAEESKAKFKELSAEIDAARQKDMPLAERLDAISASAGTASGKLAEAERLMKELADSSKEISPEDADRLAAAVADLRDKADASKGRLKELNDAVEKLRAADLDLPAELEKIAAESGNAAEQASKLEKIVAEVAEGSREISPAETELLAETMAELRAKAERTREAMAKFDEKVRDLQDRKLTLDQKIDRIKSSAKGAADASNKLKEELRKTLEKNGGNVRAEEVRRLADEIARCDQAARRLDASLDKAIRSAKGLDLRGLAKGLDSRLLGGAGGQAMAALATPAGAAAVAVAAVGKTMYDAGKAAADFEVRLDSLQALTGMTADEIDAMAQKALKLGNEFGMAGGDVVDAMKLIGSQAPELLKDSDALEEVTRNCATLAKAAGIDLEAAAKAVTGAMNQMGVTAGQTGELINALAAGAQQGAADVSYIAKVFEKAGVSGKQAGMDFTSLTAAVETVAPKFSSADVAGTQLNSVLLKLSMSGKKEFTPAAVGMQKALENLSKAEMNDAEMKALVGESGVTMLKALIDGRDAFEQYDRTLRGTNTAQEQYAINTSNMASQIDRMKAAWENFLITLGRSAILQEIAGNLGSVVEFLTDLITRTGQVIDAFKGFGSAGDDVNLFRAQVDNLRQAIDRILTATEIVVRLAAKAWNGLADAFSTASDFMRGKWNDFKSAVGNVEWIRAVYSAFKAAVERIGAAVDWLKDKWNDFLESLGMETSRTASKASALPAEITVEADTAPAEQAIADISNDLNKLEAKLKEVNDLLKEDITDARVKELRAERKEIEAQISALKKKRGLDTGSGGTGGRTTAPAEKGSVRDLRERASKLDKEITDKNVSPARLEALTKERREIQTQIVLLESRNKLAGASGTIKEMEAAYAALGNVLQECVLDEREMQEITAKRQGIAARIEDERKRLGLLEYQKGSLADQEAELQKVERELRNANLEESKRNDLLARRKELRDGIETYKQENGLLDYQKGSLAELEERLRKIDALRTNSKVSDEQAAAYAKEAEELRRIIDLENERLGLAERTSVKAYEPSTPAEKGRADRERSRANYSSNFETFRSQVKAGDMGLPEFREKMAEMKAEWEKNFPGSKLPLEFEVDKDGKIMTAMEQVEAYKSRMDELAGAVGSVGGAFAALGNAVGGAGGEVLKFVGTAAQGIQQLIPQIAKLIAAKEAEATAAGVAGAASAPWFIAPGLIAGIIATIAGIFAGLPKFAEGGIVPAVAAMTGDRAIVRANPGEMLLNDSQQSRLFRMLDGRESGGAAGAPSGKVEFTITADALKGVLRNADKKGKRIR